MNGRILGIAAGIIVAACAVVLVVAWIKGGAEPTRWIEQPVAAPGTVAR